MMQRNEKYETGKKEYPAELQCPLTLDVMTDPAITTCGHSFSREQITRVLMCPLCRAPIRGVTLKKDNMTERAIQEFKLTEQFDVKKYESEKELYRHVMAGRTQKAMEILTEYPDIVTKPLAGGKSVLDLAQPLTKQTIQKFMVDGKFDSQKYGIYCAIMAGKTQKAMEILTKYPDMLNKPLADGKTVLHLAVETLNFDLINALFFEFNNVIHVNEPINNSDDSIDHGFTALHVLAVRMRKKVDETEKTKAVQILRYLLEKGANPSVVSKIGATPLILAIDEEDAPFSLSQCLISSGKDLNINQKLQLSGKFKNDTALITAAKRADAEILRQLLLISGIDVNIKNAKGESALFIAASQGDIEKVKALLARPDIDVETKRSSDNKTAMQIAGENEYIDVVTLFTQPDTQLKLVKQKLGQNQVEEAVRIFSDIYHNNGQKICFGYLDQLEKNDTYQKFCMQIIKLLMGKEDNDLIIHLLQSNPVMLNEPLVDSKTVLHLAVEALNFDLIKALFEEVNKDMDVNLRINCPNSYYHHRTALHVLALRIHKVNATEKEKAVQILNYLLGKGADPALVSSTGFTPLMLALGNEDAPPFSLSEGLITSGKDLNINQEVKTFDGFEKDTALIIAIAAQHQRANAEIFRKLLLIPGIDVNIKNAKGESALFIAASQGDLEKVKALLERPEIDAEARRSSDNKTAIQIAGKNGYTDVVTLFTQPDTQLKLVKQKLGQNQVEEAARIFSDVYHNNGQKICFDCLDQLTGCSLPPYKSFREQLLRQIIKPVIDKKDNDLIIHLLQSNPAMLNEPLVDSKTVLHLAVEALNFDLIKALFDNFGNAINVDVRINNPDSIDHDRTVLHSLVSCICKLEKETEKAEAIKTLNYLLFEKNATPGVFSSTGATPLMLALNNERSPFFLSECLINSGKDLKINQAIQNGNEGFENDTALIIAAKYVDANIFGKLLLIPGIDVNIKNAKGESALFIAASQGDIEKVKALLAMPDIDAEAKRQTDNKTAMQIAGEKGYSDVVAFLFERYHLIDLIEMIKNLLEDRPVEKFDFDYLNQVGNLDDIFNGLKINYPQHGEMLDKIACFLKQIQNNDVKPNDSSIRFFSGVDKDWAVLNKLFHLAHQNRQNAWEIKIRDEAKKELYSSLTNKSKKEKEEGLEKACSQPVFKTHRNFLHGQRTTAVKDFQKEIQRLKKTG